jgi:hypothetical protein
MITRRIDLSLGEMFTSVVFSDVCVVVVITIEEFGCKQAVVSSRNGGLGDVCVKTGRVCDVGRVFGASWKWR